MNQVFESFKARSLLFYRALRTSVLYSISRSDVKRWGKDESLNVSWDSRTKMIAALIPDGSSVLEFGAGRMSLKRFLAPSCRYTPSDIIDRGGGTIVCDLNGANLPPFDYNDFVVFGGVLEYIFDLDRLISHLSGSCRAIIASYAVTDFSNQQSTLQRRKHGWVNNLSKKDFLNLFFRHGLVCEQALPWERQYIFKFVRGK
jgi:hypothetical protein